MAQDIDAKRQQFRYEIMDKKIRFEEAVRVEHMRAKKRILRYLDPIENMIKWYFIKLEDLKLLVFKIDIQPPLAKEPHSHQDVISM